MDILRPSALLLVFPVLFVAGFATLGARILVEVLRRTGSRASSRSPVTYLAFHRLTGLPKLTVLLVGASALCLGIFIDSQTMVRIAAMRPWTRRRACSSGATCRS